MSEPVETAIGVTSAGIQSGRICLSIIFLCATALAAAAESAPDRYQAADIHKQPLPGIRFTSGLTVCDEALWRGRWVTRYWLSTGMVEPESHLKSQEERREDLSIDAFRLTIEGQDLSGTWRWVKAEKSEVHDPDALHVTLEISSSARPISVKVHTLLYGGPVMVRCSRLTNTGKKPTAITAVSPWSGLIWDISNYQERLPKWSEGPFEVGYTQYEEWGHEGAWRFEPVVNQTKTVSGTRGKSGWGHPTFFAHNKASGEWFVSSLGWSGNWNLQVTGQQKADYRPSRLSLPDGTGRCGSCAAVLAPGETVATRRLMSCASAGTWTASSSHA